MGFVHEPWFAITIGIFIVLGIIGSILQSFEDFEDWDLVWEGIKKVVITFLGLLLLPLLVLFGIRDEKRFKKRTSK